MQPLQTYSQALEDYMCQKVQIKEPKRLYEPITYILSLGGKRLRPVLTLMSGEFFGTNIAKTMNAALAVELFHNFSLIHDDIMDQAPLRRGQATVHHKWDVNTGILSGDAMLIMAYQLFEGYEPILFQELAKLFSKTAMEVCEGQQYDMDFESRSDVTIAEYIQMINYKTAVLVGASLQMGAIVAGASQQSKDGIYEFGRNLGIAFQLQDDFLDAFGDPKRFGKQVGGDILSHKKTYLYLSALASGSAIQQESLKNWYSGGHHAAEEKIAEVKALFEETGAAKATQQQITAYTEKAFQVLETVELAEKEKQQFRDFGVWLMNRNV